MEVLSCQSLPFPDAIRPIVVVTVASLFSIRQTRSRDAKCSDLILFATCDPPGNHNCDHFEKVDSYRPIKAIAAVITCIRFSLLESRLYC